MIGNDNTGITTQTGAVPRTAGITYRPGHATICPGCGQSHWHVGRHTAECAFCATALPLSTSGRYYRPTAVGERRRLIMPSQTD